MSGFWGKIQRNKKCKDVLQGQRTSKRDGAGSQNRVQRVQCFSRTQCSGCYAALLLEAMYLCIKLTGLFVKIAGAHTLFVKICWFAYSNMQKSTGTLTWHVSLAGRFFPAATGVFLVCNKVSYNLYPCCQ